MLATACKRRVGPLQDFGFVERRPVAFEFLAEFDDDAPGVADRRSRMAEAVRCEARASATAEPYLVHIEHGGVQKSLRRQRDLGLGRDRAPVGEQFAQALDGRRALRDEVLVFDGAARQSSGSAAGSPRRVRDSGRARTDCRRRGSADCP